MYLFSDSCPRSLSVKFILVSRVYLNYYYFSFPKTMYKYLILTCRQLSKHRCIAWFEGVHYSDSPPPVVIYAETLHPLAKRRERLQSNFTAEIPQIVRDIAYGLSFLHSHWLVHMELTAETVTVRFTYYQDNYFNLISLLNMYLFECRQNVLTFLFSFDKVIHISTF